MNKNQCYLFLKQIRKDSFVIHTVVLFFGSVLIGVANYVYQLLLARMLSLEAYGETQSLLSLLSIGAVLSSSVALVTTKYTADFLAEEKIGKVKYMIQVFLKKTVEWSIPSVVIAAMLFIPVVHFFNFYSPISVVFIFLSVLLGFVSAIPQGVLRGFQKFKEFSGVPLAHALVKICVGVVLIQLGFSVAGAMGGVLIASLFAPLVSFFPLRFLHTHEAIPFEEQHFFSYSLPVFLTTLATTLLWSVDILLVKHFFPAVQAGEYSALAMIGRIIFFVVGPIIGVMFPLAAQASAACGFPAKILKKAIFLITLLGGGIVCGYWLFPSIVIKILVGEKFLGVAPFLGFFGLSMLLYSFINLFANYFLSIGKIQGVYRVILGALGLCFGIFFFHKSIGQVVFVMCTVMFFTLVFLIHYFWQVTYLCQKK